MLLCSWNMLWMLDAVHVPSARFACFAISDDVVRRQSCLISQTGNAVSPFLGNTDRGVKIGEYTHGWFESVPPNILQVRYLPRPQFSNDIWNKLL